MCSPLNFDVSCAAAVILACGFQLVEMVAAGDCSGGILSVYMENDAVADSDGDYTNGVKISWISPDLQQLRDTPYASPFLPLLDRLPLLINGRESEKNLVLSLGQNIYTPSDTDSTALVEDDRPYAGWLYFGLGVVWKNAAVRNSLVLDVGVVGPWAHADQSQSWLHDVLALDSPSGWDNQLGNEIGFTLAYERTWRWPQGRHHGGLEWEILPHAGLALGTVRTSVDVGIESRFGWHLPDDFGTPAIGPAATTSTPVNGSHAIPRSGCDLGFYGFTRIDGHAVARNIFLDGNTFSDSHSVDRNIFVADLSAGVAVNYGNTKLTYALVYRTREFEEQGHGQVFGTLSLSWEF